MIDFILKRSKSDYVQVLLEECKYIVKQKKIRKYINDDREIFSDGSDEKISDKEYFGV